MTKAKESSIFSPLNESTSSIRLIEILPGNGEIVNCTFQVFNFADSGGLEPYTALSYAWGSPASTASILIDGSLHPVRDNLYRALIVIRDKIARSQVSWKYFWIDAICINQEDVAERNHQVGLMSLIYSCAEFVLVWLGPEAEHSDLAMNFFKELSQRRFDFEDAFQQLSNKTNLDAVEALFNRPYWSRQWVIQEIVLAQEILVLCEQEICTWGDLSIFERQLPLLATLTESLYETPALRAITNRNALQNAPREWKTLDRFMRMWRISELGCADPRDRIFAWLGLVTEPGIGSLGVLRADYRKSKEEIYCDILFHLKRNPERLYPTSAIFLLRMLDDMLELNVSEETMTRRDKLLKMFFRTALDDEPSTIVLHNDGTFVESKKWRVGGL